MIFCQVLHLLLLIFRWYFPSLVLRITRSDAQYEIGTDSIKMFCYKGRMWRNRPFFIKIITNKFGWINAYLTTRLILLNCFKRWNGPEFEILLRLTTVFLLYCQAVRSLKWTREAESEGGWSPAWLAGCGSTCRTSASLLELDLACSFGGVSKCLQAWEWTVRNLTVQPNLTRRRSNTVRQVQLLSRNTDNLHRKLKCHLEIFYTAVLARWRCKMR